MIAHRRINALIAGSSAALVSILLLAHVLQPVAIIGASMRPALLPGDVAIVRRGARPRVGDVVLIQRKGHSPVMHRVRGQGPTGYVTRGDANPVDDRDPVRPGDIRGVVVARVPVGSLLEWWRATRGTRYTHGSTE